MRHALLILIFIVGSAAASEAACTGSSPTWTSTPDYTSVAACVAGITRGDTINVTAGSGTAVWSSHLSLTTGVRLVGPGRDSLTITSGGVCSGGVVGCKIYILPDATVIANDEIIRVAGFTFDGENTATRTLQVNATNATTSKAFNKLVIENNRFKNLSTGSSDTFIYISAGQVRGTVAANIFDRPSNVIRVFGKNTCTEWSSVNFPFAYGSIENIYFEDNTIQWSSTKTGGNSGYIETGQGVRIAVRYNTWDLTNAPAQGESWDMHGFQSFPGPPTSCASATGGGASTGSMIVEYYGNTSTNRTSRQAIFRGSWILALNNISIGSGTGVYNITQYDKGCTKYVDAAWPPPQGEVNNSYGFNNTMNGTVAPFTVTTASGVGLPTVNGAFNNECPPVENTQLWNYNAACTGSSCAAGIGRGTTAPTGTCTTGTGFWKASTATPTTSSTVIQAGHLYKCTATNTWTDYFTPYTYPHPLRTVVSVSSASGLRVAGVSTSTSCTVIWTASTDAALAGYNVYVSTTSGVYGAPVNIKTLASSTIDHSPLTLYILNRGNAATYYLIVKAFNTNGQESAATGEVSCVLAGQTARGVRS